MDLLKDRIREDMKAAMKSGAKVKLGVIRLIMAAIKQREVDERIELDDEQVILVLDKMVKQRRESIRQFRAAERIDLAEIEEAEIVVIQDYLPQALSDEEIDSMIREEVEKQGAVSIKDMGKVMNALKEKMQGRADMAQVSIKIKSVLAG
ncbi:MAG: GatB/YqeY domain-containing protein [Methylicorpusculum sp.]|uniref:GatB/YqeY domain-containing protein n=1 Tax=Methylicorpusculum sp. TaxID=2713644 RepID=UPI00271BC814|nr:GatB/YqeY domain-containing protein [Methylicorpusculum sp.]MDO8843322.1 GatB/YqeY domain-containing protein [Methylicorpusculum sp.]MDO8939123.1 GatB/YqeY domain-containing protein [Methylicorpusculum sp.]MDO9241369.1 GatB/YqeY domain-containing protein [Methylicorpusculum sp.]MDP2201140.1 GatB/YqeY domain-containing protein [Methylicorpusculum sp.]